MGSLLLLLITTFVSLAQADSCEDTFFSLAPVYLAVEENIYRPLMCSNTVFSFVQNLKAAGTDLSKASVVVLRHKGAPFMPVSPLQPRLRFQDKTYLPALWSFHMFLVYEGMVYDFDYTDRLQALGIEHYMSSMWNQEALSEYWVQVKPADELLKVDLNGTLTGVPLLPVSELMTTLTNTTCSNASRVLLQTWYVLNR